MVCLFNSSLGLLSIIVREWQEQTTEIHIQSPESQKQKIKAANVAFKTAVQTFIAI